MTQGPGDEQSQPLSADSAARGWVVPPGGSRVDALFLINAGKLGIGRSESSDAPIWFDLTKVLKLDALGEPGDVEDGLVHIEMVMDDETVVAAGWPESFCDAVVSALTATKSDVPEDTPEPVESAFSVEPVVRRRSRRRNATPKSASPVANVTPATEPSAAAPPATEPPVAVPSAIAPQVSEPPVAESPGTAAPVESAQRSETSPGADTAPAQASVAEAPATDHGSRSAALELEDVTYLGGFPGQTKRRKRCIATLTMEGLEVTGPTDLAVRIAWTSVNSIETQNSDEARFRTNTKIHRDSSALVIDCEDGVTLMLEARDCPTVPLRSAITQLLGDLSVVVV